ncbi:hypothetical protein GOP47_0016158 [Adiantum capillus-veneris]|uniref:PORR domain-containing protein n=1 Tax=Adiantum capillus-veneris TaxID=13818 RepID=A0A9D4ULB7_ADICA|nr:hypothetical protein GOP47_0016158 [Adiantum capillus-veneris]
MALRQRPLLDCGYGGRQNTETSNLRLSQSTLQMSFCSSLRNPFVQKQAQMLGMKKIARPLITAVIKRRKNYRLDSIVQRQKKLKLVTTIKDILIKQPGMVMSLKRLGLYRRKLRLDGKRRVIALLKKYPAVFEVFEEGCNSLYFRLTQEAEDEIFEEIRLKGDMELSGVTKIRKMLMMSLTKTLLLSKIDHLKKDLGLPDDYREVVIGNYPQYFKVIETGEGQALELTAWDPELAISAWEKKHLGAPIEDDTISGRPRRFAKLDLPRGQVLKRKDAEMLRRFQQVPYISPYADFAHYRPNSREAEKHSCGVVHELLSLMIERRTLVDHLTHYRKDYKFSQQLYHMIVRHPELFYISLKGTRDCVFLKEAYRGAELIEKDPLVLVKERLAKLVTLNAERFYRNRREGEEGKAEGDDGDDDDDDDEDGSDEFDEGEDDSWSDDDVEDFSGDELEDVSGQARDTYYQGQRKPVARDRYVRASESAQGYDVSENGNGQARDSHHRRQRGPVVHDRYVRPPESTQRKGVTPNTENRLPTRAPRRPLGYVLREQNMEMEANVPRERW